METERSTLITVMRGRERSREKELERKREE